MYISSLSGRMKYDIRGNNTHEIKHGKQKNRIIKKNKKKIKKKSCQLVIKKDNYKYLDEWFISNTPRKEKKEKIQ